MCVAQWCTMCVSSCCIVCVTAICCVFVTVLYCVCYSGVLLVSPMQQRRPHFPKNRVTLIICFTILYLFSDSALIDASR